MLQTAIRLMQSGASPSVSEVAEAAGVSRATAYRYFPSQAALIDAVVAEALGPILVWEPTGEDAAKRVEALIGSGLPRIEAFEATFKAAMRLSLEQWAKGQAGTLGEEAPFKRGHRVELLKMALEPVQAKLSAKHFNRLVQALSLLFGVEALTILKDIWGLDGEEAKSVAQWAAAALVRTAMDEGKSFENKNRN